MPDVGEQALARFRAAWPQAQWEPVDQGGASGTLYIKGTIGIIPIEIRSDRSLYCRYWHAMLGKTQIGARFDGDSRPHCHTPEMLIEALLEHARAEYVRWQAMAKGVPEEAVVAVQLERQAADARVAELNQEVLHWRTTATHEEYRANRYLSIIKSFREALATLLNFDPNANPR